MKRSFLFLLIVSSLKESTARVLQLSKVLQLKLRIKRKRFDVLKKTNSKILQLYFNKNYITKEFS